MHDGAQFILFTFPLLIHSEGVKIIPVGLRKGLEYLIIWLGMSQVSEKKTQMVFDFCQCQRGHLSFVSSLENLLR